MVPFGDNLFLWRRFRQLSQADLAQKAGIPRPNLSDIEKNKREVTLKTIRALAWALDVRPGLLVDGIPPGGKAKSLSREKLEQVALAAHNHSPITGPEEKKLVEFLLIQTDFSGVQKRKRSKIGLWREIKARYAPEVLVSLINRYKEKVQSHESTTD